MLSHLTTSPTGKFNAYYQGQSAVLKSTQYSMKNEKTPKST